MKEEKNLEEKATKGRRMRSKRKRGDGGCPNGTCGGLAN